jgi:hypothetical protein
MLCTKYYVKKVYKSVLLAYLFQLELHFVYRRSLFWLHLIQVNLKREISFKQVFSVMNHIYVC